jgi:hypothetical protein
MGAARSIEFDQLEMKTVHDFPDAIETRAQLAPAGELLAVVHEQDSANQDESRSRHVQSDTTT